MPALPEPAAREGVLGRRELLRCAAALLVDSVLPRQPLRAAARKPEQRAVVVTFGGGVRFEDTFAPEGWANIPHLVNDLAPQGLFYSKARYEGLTGHFNACGALLTGTLQNVDGYGSEPPTAPTVFECLRKQRGVPAEETWLIASNKSFGRLGGSKLRDFGDPYSANVILPKRFLIDSVKAAASDASGPGAGERGRLAERMLAALDEGYEGLGWRVYPSQRELGREIKDSLSRSLLAYFDDPALPASGDELTFFVAKELMSRLAPSLLFVNFWDIDIAHFGSYSLYIEGIRRTDRLVFELWKHAESLPEYRGKTTLFVVPEMGRDGDLSGNGFANHRSGDESCRRLWLLALGAGVPRGAVSERPIRTLDVGPSVARVLGAGLPAAQGEPLRELAF